MASKAASAPLAVVLSVIPSLPRPVLSRLVQGMIDRLDDLEGDCEAEDGDMDCCAANDDIGSGADPFHRGSSMDDECREGHTYAEWHSLPIADRRAGRIDGHARDGMHFAHEDDAEDDDRDTSVEDQPAYNDKLPGDAADAEEGGDLEYDGQPGDDLEYPQ